MRVVCGREAVGRVFFGGVAGGCLVAGVGMCLRMGRTFFAGALPGSLGLPFCHRLSATRFSFLYHESITSNTYSYKTRTPSI